MDVAGKVAIVTGGASGLGEASARALAKAGAKVAVLDLNDERAIGIAGDIGGLGLRCDVGDAKSAGDAIRIVSESLGTPQILINCAGIAPASRIVGRDGPLDLEAFRRVIDVNLVGTFNMMRLMAAVAAKAEPNEDGERGVIISTASVAAFEGQIGQAAYAASKAGVIGLMLPAAREFAAFGIRVCVIAPGIFETPMLQGLSEEIQLSLGASVPFPKRLGKATEYARLAMAIIDNPMLNGEVIRLDGAIRMQPK